MISRIKGFLKHRFPQLVYWKRCRYIHSCIHEQEELSKIWKEDSQEGTTTDLTLFEKQYFSQNGEDGIILFILNQLDLEKGTFLEIGSGDRLQCMGANLALCQGWNGVLLDAASFANRTVVDRIYEKFQELHQNTVISDDSFLTHENMKHHLSEWFQQLNTMRIDLLSIDINGNDYHVLKNILLPTVNRFGDAIERPTCARVAMEIGSYFRDARYYSRAREFAQLARYALRHERPSNRIRTLLARLWQHDGICAIGEGDLERADSCFKKAAPLITSDYSIGHANEILYEVQILLRSAGPRFDQIAHILKRVLGKPDPRVLTKWTNIELRICEAQADFQKNTRRSKDRAFARIRSILESVAKEGIVPTRAIFAPSLYAFADEYPEHKRDIQGLIRELPVAFRNAAKKVEQKLSRLSQA